MKGSAGRLGALMLATVLGTAAVAGCTAKSAAPAAGSAAGSGAAGIATAGTSAPVPSSAPASSPAGDQGSTAAQGGATTTHHATATSKPAPVLPASFPTTGPNDIQTLVDPLSAIEASDVNTQLRFQRELDPSTTARALRTWVLNPFAPDLIDYDQTAYGLHGEIKPYMDVAIASPKIVNGVSQTYPDFIGGIMAAAGATEDLYTPPTYGAHLAGYGVTIDCAHETLQGRTVCAWMGTTPGGGHVPFVGVLVILSTVPTDKAEAVAEYVASAMTP